MSDSEKVVTSPLVILKMEDGTYVHVYEGTPVPKGVDAAHLKAVEDLGMVSSKATAEKLDAKPPVGEDPGAYSQKELEAAIGTDRELARQALAAEQSGKNRSGAVAFLEKAAG